MLGDPADEFYRSRIPPYLDKEAFPLAPPLAEIWGMVVVDVADHATVWLALRGRLVCLVGWPASEAL